MTIKGSNSLREFRRQQRIEREKRVDELVRKSMRVGVVVGDDGQLARFAR